MKYYSELLICTWNHLDYLEEINNLAEKTIIIAYRSQQLLLKDYLRISKDLFMII